MKKLALIALLTLAACSTETPDTVVITHIEVEGTKWGCIGTDKKTWVRGAGNRVDALCGEWGTPGDSIAGTWCSGFGCGKVGFQSLR